MDDSCLKIPRHHPTAGIVMANEKFLIKISDRGQQYFKLYGDRLQKLRPVLVERVKRLFGDEIKIQDKILNTQRDQNCVIVGAIYKEMPLKPNVLEEYAKERAILPVPPKDSYVSDKDAVYLEDETGRTKLRGIVFQAKELITGIIVAIKGKGIEDGDFEVHEIIEADFPPQKPLQSKQKTENFVALVSGLHVGLPSSNPLYHQLFIDFVTGYLGMQQEHKMQSRIVRVVVAGNSLFTENEEKFNDASLRFQKKQQSLLTQHVSMLDRYLFDLCGSVEVDIMPGWSDPANVTMPQQPLNHCLFRKASQLNTFHRVTNPHQFELQGVSFLGHSGQILDNIEKHMDIPSRFELIMKLLRWRHLCPSCPDLLYGFPSSTDPFILTETPHVIFIGNQPKFQTGLVKGSDGQLVHIILLPSFSSNPTFALINLDTLECLPVSFASGCT